MPATESIVSETIPEVTNSPSGSGLDRSSGPSSVELLSLVGLISAILILCVALVRGYAATINGFGDSFAYMSLASAIRRWDFHGVVIKQFWGLPYAMAALSKLTGVSDRTSLIVLSIAPSLIAAWLVRRLWNGWIAAYFAILNFNWLQRSCLGGSEPLFMCFLLAAFFAVRRRHWLLASLLASLATVVRPLGFFALVGIGLTLLWNKDVRRFAAATAIGIAVGLLYSIPLAKHFGDALANVNSYRNPQWEGGWLFGFPFYGIVKGTLLYPAPWTSLVVSFLWIGVVTVATVIMVRSAEFRAYCRDHVVEALFLVPYLWCLFTYNYPFWARSNFPRFAIPILPFVLLGLYRWIPEDRRIVWGIGILSSVLAASSALGVAKVVEILRTTLHLL